MISDHKAQIISPRLAALAQALATDGVALEEFWQEVAQKHTPLVEEVSDANGNLLVTFLWRGFDLQNAMLLSYLFNSEDGFALVPLVQLPGSDVWYYSSLQPRAARATYWFSINDPQTPLTFENYEARLPLFQPDPLNPLRFVIPAETPDETTQIRSIVELPDAPPQPWLKFRDDIGHGQIEQLEIASQILNNTRPLWVYTPPDYNPSEALYPLLIFFDGWVAINIMSVSTTLDNLIAQGALPPLVAVFIDAPDGETRSRELPCYPPFAEFMVQEFLPWLHARYTVTNEASQVCVGGASYGGLAAAYLGFSQPELFGLVLAQSGSFWWKPENDNNHEWLTQKFEDSPKLKLKIYQEVGIYETTDTPNAGPTQLESNRHLHKILQSKGYSTIYREFAGGHEYVNWRGTIADALIALYAKS